MLKMIGKLLVWNKLFSVKLFFEQMLKLYTYLNEMEITIKYLKENLLYLEDVKKIRMLRADNNIKCRLQLIIMYQYYLL